MHFVLIKPMSAVRRCFSVFRRRESSTPFLFLGVLVFTWANGGAPLHDLRAESFESDPSSGMSTDSATPKGWKSSQKGAAMISDDDAHSGTQSLKIKPSDSDRSVSHKLNVPESGVLFVDFYFRPPADPAVEPGYTVDIAGARLVFAQKEQGVGTVYGAVAGRAVETKEDFPIVLESGLAKEWIRITLRQDFTSRRWDLFLDGRLVLVDQPMEKNAPRAITLYATAVGPAFLDDLEISGINPLFTDNDRDGLPDVYEEVSGGSSAYNDRDGVYSHKSNGYPVSRVQAFRDLSDATLVSASKARRVIYVDNGPGKGDDADTGEFSYRVKGRGAKVSLAAALRDQEPGATIVILESGRPYMAPSFPPGQAPDANLKIIGTVKILTE